ncbi:hira protein Slm9 [Schizosaccharomyces cryophilus OY26]|uniref:Protein HIR n=1 Tax=Schizosaccharomyces cryophilus (strain OY26 / ATCC MYA-4695 / CBS 11777 / NBRC 106824 / NRRL Y48691) TaxID=653667 RepID=S9W871_SCHCR|nr:hira protein Slm9 [Schizosaccharomyces cryophilus OY26]EPY53950.1 hira protein Slm9 [Schizosaccharomyces cryophilus OY26]
MRLYAVKLKENQPLYSISSSEKYIAIAGVNFVHILPSTFFPGISSNEKVNHLTEESFLAKLQFSASVTCVRFSKDGRYLGIATEDGTFLYEAEKWDSPFQIIAGPAYELCWSQQANLLATAWKTISIYLRKENPETAENESITPKQESQVQGISRGPPPLEEGPEHSFTKNEDTKDNKLVEYKLLKVIDGHHSFICGLAFDPLSQYLASHSLDRSLKIWRLATFALEKNISKPFEHMSINSRYLRLSWSPDGAHVAAVNAINEGTNVIAIVQRDSWTFDISLVGHQESLECTSFNPYLFSDPFQKSVIASAAHDGCICIWNTACARPTLVIKSITLAAFCDIQWSNTGFELYGVSLDGHICLLRFEESEFGPKMDQIEYPEDLSNCNFLKKPYGSKSTLEPTVIIAAPTPNTTTEVPRVRSPPSSPPSVKKRKLLKKKGIVRPASIHPATFFSQIRIASPLIKPKWEITKSFGSMRIRNHQECTKIECFIGNENDNTADWVAYLPSSVILANGTKKFWVVGTEDASIHVFTPHGRLLLPPLIVGSTPCFLECCESYLCCVASNGLLYTWDVITRKAVHNPVTMLPLFHANFVSSKVAKGPSLEQLFVTDVGSPIAVMSDGNAFAYSSATSSWLRVSEGWWMIGSQYWGSLVTDLREESAMSFLERCTDEEIIKAGRGRFLQRIVKASMLRQGYDNYEMVVSIRHLENRLMSSEKLNLKFDYHENLLLYANRVAEEGMKDRMDELCRELLGPLRVPLSCTTPVKIGNRVWDPYISSLSKRSLLKEIILHTAKHREIQRITSQYSYLLEHLPA